MISLCYISLFYFKVSAKLGIGIDEMLEAIVTRLPPPNVNRDAPFRALLFDNSFDKYRGVLSLIFVNDGSLKIGDIIQSCHTQSTYEIKTISLLTPNEKPVDTM